MPSLIDNNRQPYLPISGHDDNTNEDSKSKLSSYFHRPFIKYAIILIAAISISFFLYFKLRPPLLTSTLSRITNYRQVNHPEQPGPFWGTVQKPYPTGAFWTNLAIRNGDNPISVQPYGIKTLDVGIQVSYGPTRRLVSQVAITDPFVADLQISSTQAYVGRSIESYDNISVTMTYRTALNGKFKTYLVKGSPYITVVYDNATPIISSGLMKILTVESRVVKGSVGVQYIVTLGNFQKWLVYCSEPVALAWKDDTLTSPLPIRGIIRVAILPIQNLEAAFSTLVNYIQRYPTGAQMTTYHINPIQTQVVFQFNTIGIGSLLMYALPHQIALMNIISDEIRLAQNACTPIYSIKGKMKAMIGDVWRLTYNIAPIGWNYILTEAISLTRLDEIGKSLLQDVKTVLPQANDVYSFGKQIGRMARLSVIADSLGIADVRQQALSVVENAMIPWIQGTNPDAFVYDRTYGGLITTNGMNDPQADFGSGYYNDHHFHYGYFIYAAAIIARFDPPFFESNKIAFDALVRDICNPDPTDIEYPFARHKDFFDGHSWASGLFPQANGKGQESSSEAANAYYACYLYGQASANPTLMQFAHILLSMEIQAAQTYWHILPNSDIYDPIFAVGRMVGNMGALDVTSSTWFGNQLEYVHGINIMPLTPVTAVLFDIYYVQRQWPVLGSRIPTPTPTTGPPPPINTAPECSARPGCAALGLQGACCPNNDGIMLACCNPSSSNSGGGGGGSSGNDINDEWKNYIYVIEAMVNRDTAWNDMLRLDGYGIGGSKSNSLLWAASRPPTMAGYDSSTRTPDYNGSIKSFCSMNSACDAMGLMGKCCPSDLPPGVFLGCCPQIVP